MTTRGRRRSAPDSSFVAGCLFMLTGFVVALVIVATTGWITRDIWLTDALRARLSETDEWVRGLLQKPPDQAAREHLLRQHRLELDALHRRWQTLVAERKSEVQRLEKEIERLQGVTR